MAYVVLGSGELAENRLKYSWEGVLGCLCYQGIAFDINSAFLSSPPLDVLLVPREN